MISIMQIILLFKFIVCRLQCLYCPIDWKSSHATLGEAYVRIYFWSYNFDNILYVYFSNLQYGAAYIDLFDMADDRRPKFFWSPKY